MPGIKLSGLFLVCASLVLLNGCGSELQDLKIQNDIQSKLIDELRSELQVAKLRRNQAQSTLKALKSYISTKAKMQQARAIGLEENLEKKKSLIASMQEHLVHGGTVLPVELNEALAKFDKRYGRFTAYDSERGVVKLKSDLIFKRGSDNLNKFATELIKPLCDLLNEENNRTFDVIIAGHTDDMRILRPETREKHPTNWHLSAHRAISVLNLMVRNKLAPERISIRGFGEFQPLVPNKPNKKGNPKNRRVEIYIIPKGL